MFYGDQIGAKNSLKLWLVGPVYDHQGFSGSPYAPVAMRDHRVEIEAVTFLENYHCITAVELECAVQDVEELLSAVIVKDDRIGLSLLHMNNKRFHEFIHFWICQGLVLVADMGNMRSFGDTIPVFFSHHNNGAVLLGLLKEVANGNPKGSRNFQEGGYGWGNQVVLDLGQVGL